MVNPNSFTDVKSPTSGTFTSGQKVNYNDINRWLAPSFSGADIKIYGVAKPYRHQMNLLSGPIVQHFIDIHTISYSSFRSERPVRSLGTVFSKGYVGGSRTLAGSLVFIVADEHPLLKLMIENPGDFDGNNNHKRDFRYTMADQIPPFDVHIVFTNELGYTARVVIFNVKIQSEGQTMSIQDMYTENVMQYIATDMQIMHGSTSQSLLKEAEGLEGAEIAVPNPLRFEDILRNSPDARKILKKTRNPFK